MAKHKEGSAYEEAHEPKAERRKEGDVGGRESAHHRAMAKHHLAMARAHEKAAGVRRERKGR